MIVGSFINSIVILNPDEVNQMRIPKYVSGPAAALTILLTQAACEGGVLSIFNSEPLRFNTWTPKNVMPTTYLHKELTNPPLSLDDRASTIKDLINPVNPASIEKAVADYIADTYRIWSF